MNEKPVAFSRAGFRSLLIAAAVCALVPIAIVYAIVEWA